MEAEIIAVGNELLLGQVTDTNSPYLSRALAGAGLPAVRHTVVGDDEEALVECIRDSLARSCLVVVTGGLGPTEDDPTRAALGKLFGEELAVDRKLLATIRSRLKKRHLRLPERLSRQAEIPRGARILPNEVGTAPGLVFEEGLKIVVALPGVPSELEWMTEHQLLPLVRDKLGPGRRLGQRVLHTFGLSELTVEEELAGIVGCDTNPSLGLTSTPHGVDLRLLAEGDAEADVDSGLSDAEERIRECLGDAVYGTDGATMEQVVGLLLTMRGARIAVAESCTGGLVADRLTAIPGSSEYFSCGVVAYSNAAKTAILGIGEAALRKHGAVSSQTAQDMASSVRKLTGSDLGLGITGIAGPGGGSAKKPVGLVYIALAADSDSRSEEHRFGGTRAVIKARASQAALALVRSWLLAR